MIRKKAKVEEAVSPLSFKRLNENGYEIITPLREDFWETPIQIGFTVGYARLVVPDEQLISTDKNKYEGEIEVKKGFDRTFFEKRGAGYSSVAGDYYVPSLKLPVRLSILDFGEQIVIKRTNGFKTYYVDSKIDAKQYIPEEIWEQLSEDNKIYFSDVDTASLRADFLEWMKSTKREQTPYNLAIWNISQRYNIFKQTTEEIKIDVPTDQWENANIVIEIGTEAFGVDKYSLFCKKEYGFMVMFNFRDEILQKIKEDGYKEEK